MKKAIFLCMVLAIFLCFTISYAQASEISTLKVGLYYGSTAQESVTLTSDSGFDYGVFNGYFEYQGTMAETALYIGASNSTLVINGVLNIDYEFALFPASGHININGSAYRGGVLLKAADSKITVINIVNIEEYLYGVIGGEMPSSWNIEALKAQAVCARNFTISNINKHASLGFNVCASTNCQVYKGISAESPAVLRAVDETAGHVLMYNGSPAETLYFSCSGGHTANAKNVWGSDIPYLRGVEDPYESPSTPRHSWSVKLSASDIKAALEKSNVYIGDIVSIDAQNDNTGRVYSLTITGTSGTHTLKNSSTSSVFSSYGVLSNKYTITASATKSESSLYIKSAYGTTKPTEYYVIDGSGSVQPLASSFQALASRYRATLSAYSSSAPTEYIFNGGGWGHGVGMSQYGAKGMADNGFNYAQILSHYFPGTYLE